MDPAATLTVPSREDVQVVGPVCISTDPITVRQVAHGQNGLRYDIRLRVR